MKSSWTAIAIMVWVFLYQLPLVADEK